MFRTANKVTRPEKALILGFMAGSRGTFMEVKALLRAQLHVVTLPFILLADNPCPKLGNIVTVMLSENVEEVTQADGTAVQMLVETHFQMNYMNGEWKRIKKNRRVVTEETAASASAAPAPSATATASN